jgi:hypothetical protein
MFIDEEECQEWLAPHMRQLLTKPPNGHPAVVLRGCDPRGCDSHDDGDEVELDHSLWEQGYCIDTEDGYQVDANVTLVGIEPAIWDRITKSYRSICANMAWLWKEPMNDARGRRLRDGSVLVELHDDTGPLALYTVKGARITFRA